MNRKIFCSILTPDRVIYERQIDLAVVQAHDGEMGFMYNHAPLVTELGIGEIRLRNNDNTEYIVVEGGIAEIRDNKLIVLTENAFKKEDLSIREIEQRLEELKATTKFRDVEEEMRLETELKKQKARLKVASR